MAEDLIKVEYVIPKNIEKEIAEKISETVKEAYFWNVTTAVSDKVIEALSEDGFTGRVATAVVEKIKISEEDYIEGVTDQIKDALMKTTGILSKEVLKKVEEKVKSYGFITIGK